MNLEVNHSHKDFFFDKTRFLISYGGAGSGKSYTTAQKLLLRILTEENHRILVVRKVAKTLRVSVFQLFRDLIGQLGLYNEFNINKSDMTITYKKNNSQLLFLDKIIISSLIKVSQYLHISSIILSLTLVPGTRIELARPLLAIGF